MLGQTPEKTAGGRGEAASAVLIEVGAGAPRTFVLGETTTIGRAPESTVRLDDPMVSMKHAEIRRSPDNGYSIVDLGSRRGTFVGDRRTPETALSDGDEILIGPVRLRFENRQTRSGVRPLLGISSPPEVQRRFSLVREQRFRPVQDIEALEELRQDYEKLRTSMELTRAIGVEHDPFALFARILDTAFQLFRAERGAILLLDQDGKPAAQLARERGGQEVEMVLPSSIVSEVVAAKAAVITADACVDSRFDRSGSIGAQGIRSVMCVPILFREEILGVLHLDSRGADVFNEKDLELCVTMTTQAALAIKNAMLVQRIQRVVAEDGERLKRVVRALPCAVLLLDAQRRLVMANDRANAMSPLLGAMHQGDVVDRIGSVAIDELLARRGDVDATVLGPPKRIFALSASEAIDSAEHETVVVIRDVTEEREREESSAQQERLALIGQLAGGVAHDFNNLLAMIVNYADFVTDVVDSPEIREDVEQIRFAAERAAELTRQLLAFSRKEVIKPRVIDLNHLVGDMEKLLRRTIREHVPMRTRFAPDLWKVRADPTKIEQVVLNLAVNARDAMPDGGTLRIETSNIEIDASAAEIEGVAPGRYATLMVHDTGVGMSPEVARRVFEPFFTTKEKGRGTGLGLATVYGIVKQAGGGITVDSAPGMGSSFRVLLPATDDGLSSLKEAGAAAGGGRETVLIAEDQAGVREVAKRILKHSGYAVIVAANGEEALLAEEKHEGPIHLLLTDMVMPGMSGKELSEKLCRRRPDLRVLYMSGYVDDAIAPDGVLEKSVVLLPKPFTRDDLLARVRDVLDHDGPPSSRLLLA